MPTRRTPENHGGWPDLPGDTALTIHVPEADTLVRTPSRAHITLLYPFLPLDRITPEMDADLRALFAATPQIALTFTAVRHWPGVLYLPPAPDDPLRALTKSVRERWPEAVPYRGIFGDEGLDPHLTLASGAGTDDIPETEFTPELPLHARVESVKLIVTEGAGTGWRDIRTYALGAQAC
ncbi:MULTISPECIES: 2'-5' RNA ligase family protein [unclassified Streptomyces]|uniref:2'-5' RNA ligase family protein n=1 Tax=unclassified Streptomyces TaxID=2593676 RepID=UPI002E17D5AA|nr:MULTISPECIES: 2'-5' RNA ligase family protein [unclassified Streptomyces]